MTPQQRAQRTYWAIVAVIIVLSVVLAPKMSLVFSFGGIGFAAFLLIVFWIQFRVNRCPHCKCSVDLRGSVRFCPRCGKEIQ
jgi:hypothetical protein